MGNNVSMVILAIIIVLLIVILPVYNIYTRQDDMSYNIALKAVTNFADKVRTTGRLTYEDYDRLKTQLSSTNNSYNIEIEAHKDYYLKDTSKIYFENCIIDYTYDILQVLKGTYDSTSDSYAYDGEYTFEKGERIFVRINNTNITRADALLSSIKLMDSNSKIDIDYGGVVLVNSVKK